MRTMASPAFLRSTSIVVTPSSRVGAALHRSYPQWHSLQCHFVPAKWRRGRAAPTNPSHAPHSRGNCAGGTIPTSYPRASSYAFALAFKLHDCMNSVSRHRAYTRGSAEMSPGPAPPTPLQADARATGIMSTVSVTTKRSSSSTMRMESALPVRASMQHGCPPCALSVPHIHQSARRAL